MASQRKNNLPSSIIKAIPIIEIISKFIGATPARIKGDDYWYISFIRPKEIDPSLKVNAKKNIWYDYGLGDGGNGLDLLMYYQKTTDINFIATTIRSYFPNYFLFDQPYERNQIELNPDKSLFEILKAIPLSHPALLSYIDSRCINLSLIKRYCLEVWYKRDERVFFTIGFKSDAGYEFRNKQFQGCTGKGITFIENGSKACTIFEGFFSWLSLFELYPEVECSFNHIILNSTSNYSKAEETIKKHDLLKLYLDRDGSGYSVVSRIDKLGISYKDESDLYTGFNDLNEYLVNLRKGNV